MAIVTDATKAIKVLDDSFAANVDLSSYQYRVVTYVAQSTGKAKVGLPSGQGVFYAGVLLNAPTSGNTAQIRLLGASKIEASGAFNAGIELAITDATGKVSAAASGDYVVGIAREASKGAGHQVSVSLIGPYQKN
jgi:hypothetical protein